MKPTAGVGCALRELPLHTTVAGLRGTPRILVVDTQPSLQMALGSSFQGMFWSALVLLASEGNSDLRLQQPRGPVYVQTGADLTLECTVTGPFQAGPVKWFKGEGDGRKLIFTNYYRLNRVTRKEEDSKKDFTIFLHQVVPEDAGIYYCVKQKIILGGGEDLQSGRGTEVFVDHIWVEQSRGPVHVQTGAVLTLECTVTGGIRPGPVKWFKGEGAGRELIFTKNRPPSRVTRKEEDSSTDFTIFLHNVVPEDAGVYYCVKQRTIAGGGEDLQRGRGTEVFVHNQWLSSNPGLWVAFVLNKIVAAGVLSFLFLRKMLNTTNMTRRQRPKK